MIASACIIRRLRTNEMFESRENRSGVIALEKQEWREWSNKNAAFVQSYLAERRVLCLRDGIVDKAQIVEAIPGCDLKSFFASTISRSGCSIKIGASELHRRSEALLRQEQAGKLRVSSFMSGATANG